MLTLTQIKALTDISYVPFGIILLLAPIDVFIKVAIFCFSMPAAFLGLLNPEKDEKTKMVYDVMNFFVQPLFRFQFAMSGTIIALLSPETSSVLALSVALPFIVILTYVSIGWFKAVLSASGKKDQKRPFMRNPFS